MIYLDNSATTRPEESVIASFKQVSEKYYGNPSSIHQLGGQVETLQAKARTQAAQLLNIEADEVVFTSGGTESNNLAIKGIALQHQNRGKHIITTEIEHAAVYDTCKSLEQLGFHVTYLPVNEAGLVQVEDLQSAMTDETILVSVMHVNNEVGSIQPIEEIGAIVKQYPKAYFHVDAVQSLGKLPIHIKAAYIDLCSFSGHKINGLKGTGMLYVKKGTSLFPLFHGGGQENMLRSGTENVAGNVSFVRALRLIVQKENERPDHFKKLMSALRESLDKIEGVFINSPEQAAAHIVNVSVVGLKPEVVIHALYERGIVLSTQSACSSKDLDESRVLAAMHLPRERTISGLRISLGYHNTMEEIETFVDIFKNEVTQLRKIMRDI